VLTQRELPLRRPDGLPDFTNPPLTEVVVSIQFATPPKYSEAYIREIWALFESDFPKVQEMPAIPPTFEVFGGPELPAMRLNFGVITGGAALRNRYWFLSASEGELIQFQQDRFMHNWRKVPGQKSEYPRFDPIISKYTSELETLETYFRSKTWGPIVPTQCELTYVNQMPLKGETGQPIPKSFYFRKLDVSLDEDVNDFAVTLRKAVTAQDGKPIGRLFVEAATAVDSDGHPVLGLNVTVRGAPAEASRTSALEFLQSARVLIDTTFVAFTSDAAHQKWGRTQ
jgi:uncharacterized protein (TIGR04255 family)